jgi:REP element-mobilizing transposase RayT
MPRAGRSFEEGRTYHVYNRVAGGRKAFEDDELARTFVDLFRQAVDRDEVAVLGWCLLGNHYHMILRQGPVPLSRTMKTIQQGVTRKRNLREGTYGPLWQGRFKAKEVSDDDYLRQLVAYVHLNPVKANRCRTVDDHRLSGHRDVVGKRRNPIVRVDDVLLLFGDRRREALRHYRRTLAGIGGEEWAGEGPGNLPWWRLGRPTEEERLKRSEGAYIDELGRSTAMWRPRIEARDWVNLACAHLGVNPEELKGHGRDPEIVKCRELIGLVGIERYGVKVIELAEVLEKSRDGVSKWMRRGAVRRVSDPEFAEAAQALDHAAWEEP